MSDERDRLAKALTKAALVIYQQGNSTFTEAVDKAFDLVNPEKKVLVTLALYAQLFGVPDDPIIPKRHQAAFSTDADISMRSADA